MRSKFLLLLLLLSGYRLSAQLLITPGAQLFISGNTQLTLQDISFRNEGSFTAGNSMVRFTGVTSSAISGNQPIQFNELEINKTGNSSVLLFRAVGVSQRILFSSGFLHLNGFNADLGTTGHLDGEQENARIIGPNGGEVLFNVNLNSPANSNPANLGIFISSGANLGNVTIKRGHRSQVNGAGLGTSILRYYDIIPSNNVNLNATLLFKYFDGELNGLNENAIRVFKSQDNINWADIGSTSRDVVANFVVKNGIGNFGRFTLSTANGQLPVQFVLFSAKCEANKVLINWKTAQEQNSRQFDIERSVDAVHWTVIGTLPAAGNSNNESSYAFTDNAPLQNAFYRIAEYDLDGRVQYTDILRSSCASPGSFSLGPNPVHDLLFINIVSQNGSQATVKIFDSKGALVKMQRANLLLGNNQLTMDMVSIANGMYLVSVEWNNGQMKKTVQVVKQ